MAFYCGVIVRESEEIVETLPRMVEKEQIDALVIDPIRFFVELGAKRIGLP